MSTSGSTSARGTAAMLASAVLFAVVFLLSGVVDTTGEVAFGWRMTVTAACYGLALAFPGPRALLRQFIRTVRERRWNPVVVLILTAIMGVQLWLFSWAPQNGYALDASLGFLLMPITMVLGGRIFLGSHVSPGQWIAVGLAVLAVLAKLVFTPSISWVTLVLCLAYPVYIITRNRTGLDNPMAFGVEATLIAPVGLFFIITAPSQPAALTGYLPLVAIGLAGAGAVVAYLASARLLPVPLFGLLGYVELVLLVAVSFMLGERLAGGDFVVYGLLAIALVVLAVEGVLRSRR